MRIIRHTHRDDRRSGKVVFWLVLCLTVIISVIALTVDGGRMLTERRRVSAVADACALTAATRLRTGFCGEPDFTGEAKTAAINMAMTNGYGENEETSVIVNIPPKSGEFAGMATHAEVIIESRLAGTFSSVLTQERLVIRARSVAQSLRREIGLIVLKETGKEVLFVNSGGTVDVQTAPVLVNSNDPVAYHVTGNSTVIADSHKIQGGHVVSNGGKTFGPVSEGTTPQFDPLYCLPDINLIDYLTQELNQLVVKAGSITLNPGIFKGGISIVGDGNVTLNPGVYIMDGGGFSYTGDGDLTADGVTIVNTGTLLTGQIRIEGNGNVKITAPESGIYAGISIFQARHVTETLTISGNGNMHLEGIIYAPKGHVELMALGTNLSNYLGGGYVTNTMAINGDGSMRIGAALHNPAAASVRLVE